MMRRSSLLPIASSYVALLLLAFVLLLVVVDVGVVVAASTENNDDATSSSSYDVVSLTRQNYDELTDGKAVFIKFYAPWCGHCKAMAPAWEKLAKDWDNDEVGLIAQVDCTSDDGKPLCDENGVRGFPTLKYGDPTSALDEYQGKRGYDELSAFAKSNLKRLCNPNNLELCDDAEKEQIQQFMEMSIDEINERITNERQKLRKAEDDFNDAVEKLQEEYAKLSEDKDKTILGIREGGLGYLKSVKSYKEKHGEVGGGEGKTATDKAESSQRRQQKKKEDSDSDSSDDSSSNSDDDDESKDEL